MCCEGLTRAELHEEQVLHQPLGRRVLLRGEHRHDVLSIPELFLLLADDSRVKSAGRDGSAQAFKAGVTGRVWGGRGADVRRTRLARVLTMTLISWSLHLLLSASRARICVRRKKENGSTRVAGCQARRRHPAAAVNLASTDALSPSHLLEGVRLAGGILRQVHGREPSLG